MGLFDIFKNKKKLQDEKPQIIFEGPSIFYHEDDFRQVEIVPGDNLLTLTKESEEVDTFSKKNYTGSGFNDIYVRNDNNKIELNQRQIDPNDLEKILSLLEYDRIPNVLTGYGQTHRELHKDCIAFAKNYNVIYYDFKENVVQHIWLTNHWGMDRVKLAKCLNDLGQQWGLLLQDWNLTVTIDLCNKESIDNYLATYDNE